LANRHLPELKTHDRFENRIDWVDFHPSWHQLMSLAWKHEVPNLAWRTNQKKRALRSRGALLCLESGRTRVGLSDRYGLCVLCRL
jgi:hypothetical protein